MEVKFEDKMLRLEEISKILENGECSLEDAVKLYDEAKKIANECEKTLKEAKQKNEVVD